MPRNVEIKARVSDLETLKQTAGRLADGEPTVIVQKDTFFNVPNGRLKLREKGCGQNLLIQYTRPDQDGPKLSDYYIAEVQDADSMKKVLSQSLGIKGEVHKTRVLLMIGQTRVHLDDVKGLGHFMELEVVLRDEQTTEEGQQIAENIMGQLDIKAEDLITGAYMDMLGAPKDSATKMEDYGVRLRPVGDDS